MNKPFSNTKTMRKMMNCRRLLYASILYSTSVKTSLPYCVNNFNWRFMWAELTEFSTRELQTNLHSDYNMNISFTQHRSNNGNTKLWLSVFGFFHCWYDQTKECILCIICVWFFIQHIGGTLKRHNRASKKLNHCNCSVWLKLTFCFRRKV